MLSVKNVKTFIGMEGHGFNANLYLGKKKICLVIDSAHGGCYDYQWSGSTMEERRENEREFKAIIDALPPEKIRDDAPAWEKSLYPDGFRKIDHDEFISSLIDKYELDRHRKNHVLFTTGKSAGGSFFKIKHFGKIEETRSHVMKSHPDAVFI